MENKLSIKELNTLKPLDVVDDPRVRERFVSLYNKIHNTETGEMFYEREKYNFQRIIQNSADLKQCTSFSIYGVLLDIASYGLSLDQASQPLMYVLFYNCQVGKNWEKRAIIEISPYGELALRIQAGQISYADRPVVAFEGDKFQPLVNDMGNKIVLYKAAVPRVSKTIIGSFIKLVRPNGSFDFFWMLPEDVERLSRYSEKKNKKTGANALYTSNGGQIDTGFLEAKTIKHAFKTFPKLKLGQFSQLQQEDTVQAMDYGLNEEVHSQTPVQEAKEIQPEEEKQEPQSFDQAPVQEPQGVTVEDDDEIF